MKEQSRTNWSKVIGYMIIYLAFFSMGIVGGMLLQQSITQATMMKVAGSLDGVQVDINFNETLMMDAMMDNFEEMGLFNESDIVNDTINVDGEVKK